MKNALKLMAATIALLGNQAMAAPVTLEFSGTLNYSDASTNEVIYQDAGFVGSVTYDLAGRTAQVNTNSVAGSASLKDAGGCDGRLDGVCTYQYGTPDPVVTRFTVTGAFGAITIEPDLSGPKTSSSIVRNVYYSAHTQEATYRLTNEDDSRTTDGSDYTLRTTEAYLYLGGGDGLFNDFQDLAGAINFGNASSADFNLDNYSKVATGGILVRTGYKLSGSITDLHVANASADVPEPASLAILGLGFAGIAAARQRRK